MNKYISLDRWFGVFVYTLEELRYWYFQSGDQFGKQSSLSRSRSSISVFGGLAEVCKLADISAQKRGVNLIPPSQPNRILQTTTPISKPIA